MLMPDFFELASHVVLLGLVVAGLRYLRQVQPDPNPAIEARLAAEEAARLAAAGDVVAVAPSPANVEVADRRQQELPYVGIDRRTAQLATDARTWRQSA